MPFENITSKLLMVVVYVPPTDHESVLAGSIVIVFPFESFNFIPAMVFSAAFRLLA